MTIPQTNGNGQIQKREEQKAHPLVGLLTSKGMHAQIAAALPKHVTPERMARVALTALRTTKDLQLSTKESFLACIMQAAQIGLEVNTPLGHAWLIPRKSKGLKANERECTLMIGYQGLIDLARRSGNVLGIWAFPIYDGDAFKVSYGLAPKVEHEPKFDKPHVACKGSAQNNTLRYVYAAAKLRDNPDPVFVLLSYAEVEGYRKRGASGQNFSTPWDTDYEAMALKTAVRRLYRWLPKSIEMARAQEVDEASELGLAQTFAPEIVEAIEKGSGLELPSGMEAETLDTSDIPESAKHAQPIESKSKSSPGTQTSYDPSEQDAPPPDDVDEH